MPAVVIEKLQLRGHYIGAAVPGLDLFLDPLPFCVVTKVEPQLRNAHCRCGGGGFHGLQTVLAVPSVSPAAVARQVAIEIMGKDFRRFGHEDIPRVGCAARRGHRDGDVRISRRRRVGDTEAS